MATAPKKPFTSDPDVDRDLQGNNETPANNSATDPQKKTSNDSEKAGTIKIGS
jgi:hypothetical protein